MKWLTARAEGDTPLAQVVGLRPELRPLLDDLLAAVWATEDPLVLELCRLRIATLHDDDAQVRLRHDAAVRAGLTEDHVAALARYPTSPLFTEHQRRCIAYAEQYVLDVHGISDADAAAVRAGMSDGDFVAFTVALGLFDGVGRLRLLLDVEDPPPAGSDPVVVPVPSATDAAH